MNGAQDYMQALEQITNGIGQTHNCDVAHQWGWNYGDYWYPYPYERRRTISPFTSGTVTVTAWPQSCSGDTHVFACEHADKCKCGKANRTPEPKKCGACGK